ncbi:hypothetical protein [Treponema pectinovorum]|uniref:hypothetical protein n=1 Tax=Treponema pectinovorum TaxID=164 RepID=UPI0011C9CC39|nr:hypothetical protein [Treponema pectinovorum]
MPKIIKKDNEPAQIQPKNESSKKEQSFFVQQKQPNENKEEILLLIKTNIRADFGAFDENTKVFVKSDLAKILLETKRAEKL